MSEFNGYESPIEIAVKKTVNDIMEERDNAIIAKISEEMAININKEELFKALAYDRDQYNKGYRDGEIAGYAMGYKDALEKVAKRVRELFWPEKTEDKNNE